MGKGVWPGGHDGGFKRAGASLCPAELRGQPGEGADHPIRLFPKYQPEFDTIALNPPIHAGKAVMYAMYEGAYAHLNAGGRFYVVIQKKHGLKARLKS